MIKVPDLAALFQCLKSAQIDLKKFGPRKFLDINISKMYGFLTPINIVNRGKTVAYFNFKLFKPLYY